MSLFKTLTEDFGKLLDRQDEERANTKNDDLYYQSKSELQTRFLGNVIANQYKNNSTLLTGPQCKDVENIIPFFYFYPSLSLQICPSCPQARNPLSIKPFLERGLISVFLTGPFSESPTEFQKLAFEYPEYFVGPSSYYQYKYFSLNIDPNDIPDDTHDHEHYCAECLKEKIQPHLVNFDGLTETTRRNLSYIQYMILTNPSAVSNTLTDLFIDTLKSPNVDSIHELNTTANLTFHLSSAQALGSIPQMNSEFFRLSNLFLQPLRILHNQNLEPGEYLDLLQGFRGVLSPESVPRHENAILSTVMKINGEVDKIKSSKKLPLGVFLSSFILDIPLILTNILAGGTYGTEGMYNSAIKNFKSRRLSEIKNNILSKYFGVSKLGIQVWEIRKKLDDL